MTIVPTAAVHARATATVPSRVLEHVREFVIVPCSYCKNLNYAQQLQQPYVVGQYVDYQCVLPVSGCIGILAAEAALYFLLALYFDNVFANENGVRRRPWCAPMQPRVTPGWSRRRVWNLAHRISAYQRVLHCTSRAGFSA